MSAVSTTLGTRRDQPLLTCALVALAVVVGLMVFDHWYVFHALPRIGEHWGYPAWPVRLVLQLVPFALYAAVLAVWGRSPAARVAGACCALATGVLMWALAEGFQRFVVDRGHLGQHSLEVYSWTVTLLQPTLLAACWGLARRRGRVWPLGLPIAPAAAAVLHELDLHVGWWQRHVYPGTHPWVAGQLVVLTPVVLAAIACWLVEERLAPPPYAGPGPEMQSSA